MTPTVTRQSWNYFRPPALASSPVFVMKVAYSFADKFQIQVNTSDLLQPTPSLDWSGLPSSLTHQYHLKMNCSGGSKNFQRFPHTTTKEHHRINTLVWNFSISPKILSFLLILTPPPKRPVRRFGSRSVHGSQGPYSPQVSTVEYPTVLYFPTWHQGAKGHQCLGCRVRYQSNHSANPMSLASMKTYF